MSLHLTWDRAPQGLEGHSSTQCQESLVSKTRHMRITVRRGRHHFSLWQPWCLLRKELPSARCQLLCNELWEMNYAMTIWQKLYKQDGQTEAMAVFIVGQMPGSTLSQKIPLACSGAGRCLFLPQKLIPLPTDTRRSSFRCHYFILKQNSQSRAWPTLWSLFNRARPVWKTVVLDSKEVKQWASCLYKQCVQHPAAEHASANFNRPSDL